jgi:hypothetical protein
VLASLFNDRIAATDLCQSFIVPGIDKCTDKDLTKDKNIYLQLEIMDEYLLNIGLLLLNSYPELVIKK